MLIRSETEKEEAPVWNSWFKYHYLGGRARGLSQAQKQKTRPEGVAGSCGLVQEKVPCQNLSLCRFPDKSTEIQAPIHENRSSPWLEARWWLSERSHTTWGEPSPLSWLWDLLDSHKPPAGSHPSPWDAIPGGKVLFYPRSLCSPLCLHSLIQGQNGGVCTRSEEFIPSSRIRPLQPS